MEEVREGIQHLTQENGDPLSTSSTTASKTGTEIQNKNKNKDNQKQTFCHINRFFLKQECHNVVLLSFFPKSQ